LTTIEVVIQAGHLDSLIMEIRKERSGAAADIQNLISGMSLDLG
jgi:hypothetical protein